jgi:hypothetical protein
MKKRIGACVALTTLWSNHALSQSETPKSDTEISKQIEIPITRRITLPLRYEADFLDGPYKAIKERSQSIRQWYRSCADEEWILATQTKLQAVVQPPKKLGNSWAGGLSDGYTTFFCRRDMARVFTEVPGRCSTIPGRRTRRSASTNGAPARRSHS